MSFKFNATFSLNPKESAAVYCVNSELEFLQSIEKELADKIIDCMRRVVFKAKIGSFLSLFPDHDDVLIGGVGEGLKTRAEAEK